MQLKEHPDSTLYRFQKVNGSNQSVSRRLLPHDQFNIIDPLLHIPGQLLQNFGGRTEINLDHPLFAHHGVVLEYYSPYLTIQKGVLRENFLEGQPSHYSDEHQGRHVLFPLRHFALLFIRFSTLPIPLLLPKFEEVIDCLRHSFMFVLLRIFHEFGVLIWLFRFVPIIKTYFRKKILMKFLFQVGDCWTHFEANLKSRINFPITRFILYGAQLRNFILIHNTTNFTLESLRPCFGPNAHVESRAH